MPKDILKRKNKEIFEKEGQICKNLSDVKITRLSNLHIENKEIFEKEEIKKNMASGKIGKKK